MHGSLLPKYRGAGPIQWALINGETETGITTMLMDEGMDTGAMLLQEKNDDQRRKIRPAAYLFVSLISEDHYLWKLWPG